MPRTKKKTKARKVAKRVTRKVRETNTKKVLFRWGESYTSLLMGIVVVIIAVLFVGSVIKVKNTQETSSISTIPLPSDTQLKNINTQDTQKTYTVKQGDSLWTIAEDAYGSGYNWVDIAKANNLENPDILNEGTVLVLPKITPVVVATVTPTPQVTFGKEIKTDTYVVEKGDSLWDIAVRSYADGYRWVDIARANNLENPNLIFSGNTLRIPR